MSLNDDTANVDSKNVSLMNVRVEWEDRKYRPNEHLFEHLIRYALVSQHGILGGAAIIELVSFDEENQRAIVSIIPPSKMKELKSALYFLTSYQGVRCRALMDA